MLGIPNTETLSTPARGPQTYAAYPTTPTQSPSRARVTATYSSRSSNTGTRVAQVP